MNKATRKLSENLENIAKLIDNEIEIASGERIGFALIVYTEGRASYISNVDRNDAIEHIEFLLELWKKEMPDIKAHEVQ